MCGAISPCLHTSSWLGAWLNTWTTLPLRSPPIASEFPEVCQIYETQERTSEKAELNFMQTI